MTIPSSLSIHIITRNDLLALELKSQCEELLDCICIIENEWQNEAELRSLWQERSTFVKTQQQKNIFFIIDLEDAAFLLQQDKNIAKNEADILQKSLIIYDDNQTALCEENPYISIQNGMKRPFSLLELIDKIEDLSLSFQTTNKHTIIANIFELDEINKEIYHLNAPEIRVKLTEKERDILLFLSSYQGEIVSRETLLEQVFEYHQSVDTHTLGTHIYRLRQKLSQQLEAENIIKTEEGGYRLA